MEFPFGIERTKFECPDGEVSIIPPPVDNKLTFNPFVKILEVDLSTIGCNFFTKVEIVFGTTKIEFYIYRDLAKQFTDYVDSIDANTRVKSFHYKTYDLSIELVIELNDGRKHSFNARGSLENV